MSWFDRLLERAEPKDEDTAKRAAVDVAASVSLKDRHRPYGEFVRELAKIAKAFYDPTKHKWNFVWAVTTKAFSIWKSGFDKDCARYGLLFVYGGVLDREVIEKIVDEVYKQAPSLADRYRINRQPPKPCNPEAIIEFITRTRRRARR